ncbi:MAG TPA: glycerate kinase [Planctomycetota bacterium]|nr:glycerate kinase [Planctomycetota bacterium]
MAASGKRKVVVACATFKGTLSSKAAGEAVARGLAAAGMEASVAVLADGGEGLVEALAAQVPGSLLVGAPCRCPLLNPRTATFAVLPKSEGRKRVTAVIEMAASSGLTLVPEDKRDPKIATSLGVGDQILAALEHQPEDLEILLGLGGSATNDGGAGMAQALGAHLLDGGGVELEPGGAALAGLAKIDISELEPRLKNVPVTVACDVRNPLCGPNGASHIFGKQKGGTPADLELLDKALAHYAGIIKCDLGKDVANIPGAGAAGGLGAGCLAFLNAQLKPGIELVLDAIDFDRTLDGASLVITGEGMLDDQTLMGKAPSGVAARAAKKGLRCVAIGGSIDQAHEAALRKRFNAIESLTEKAGSVESAMQEPARWLEHVAHDSIARWLS